MTAAASSADWVEILRAEVAGRSMGAVAEQIGVSRTAISLVLAGKYPVKTPEAMERRVRDTFERRHCPFLDQALAGDACRRYRERPMPRSSARDLRHWRACQACPHNPDADPTHD